MRITDSVVQLNNQHSTSRQQEQQTRVLEERPDVSTSSLAVQNAKLEFSAEDSVALSSYSQKLAQAADGEILQVEFVQALSSERILNTVLEGFEAWQAISLQSLSAAASGRTVGGIVTLQVETAVTQQVFQSSLFTAQGTVTDENGNEIRFQLGLQLQSQQQLKAQSEFTIIARPRKDPLVINFGAASAQLTDTTFDFNLNSEGPREKLAQLGSGSGYLVFDKNKNGIADNGSELFGVASGDGFADLAQYDSDGNLWLDESDPMFTELSVWVIDENGSSALFSLHELGVGAIHLGSTGDDFELTSSLGVPLGSIRAHSVVIMENGDVRTAQQLDLVDLRPAVTQVGSASVTTSMRSSASVPPSAPEASEQSTYAREAMDSMLAGLARLRQHQQEYQLKISEEDLDLPKSILEQLLQKMDELRAHYRETQAQRERVGKLYRRD